MRSGILNLVCFSVRIIVFLSLCCVFVFLLCCRFCCCCCWLLFAVAFCNISCFCIASGDRYYSMHDPKETRKRRNAALSKKPVIEKFNFEISYHSSSLSSSSTIIIINNHHHHQSSSS